MANAGCTNTTQCAIAGTACQQHGPMGICIPIDKAECDNFDDLFVLPVKDVYTMFCNQGALRTVPPEMTADTCESWEISHRGICLLPECSTAQLAAASQECWIPEMPTGAVAAPTPDRPVGSVTRTLCTSSQQCRTLVPGTSCIQHANLQICVPDDRTGCVAVEPLHVVPVGGVYAMFCNQASIVPALGMNQTCAQYEGDHGGLCLLPGCTPAQLGAGSKQCFFEALPGSQTVEALAAQPAPSSGLSGGAIAGIVIGVLALIAMIVAGIVLYRKRKSDTNTLYRLDGFEAKLRADAQANPTSSSYNVGASTV